MPDVPQRARFDGEGAPENEKGTSMQAVPRVAEPPDLHWLLLLVLEICTLGIFGTIWIFRQARWAKKVDPISKATVQLAAAVIVFVVAGLLTAIPEFQIWGALLHLGGVAGFLLGSFRIKRVME